MVYLPGGGMKMEAAAPVPSLSSKQVLVKVHSAGLNPVRWRACAGVCCVCMRGAMCSARPGARTARLTTKRS
jgi:NADPH:quinone reductase-like Zn-dependent oxidoreductase